MAADSSNTAATVPIAPEVAPRDVDRPLVVANRRLGRYLGIEEIAKGGMGRVLRAYDPRLRREVALKVLRGEPTSEGRARVVREAQALARLAHPNVVAVFDVEEADGELFLALEYVPGRTLRQWLDVQPRSVAEVMSVFLDIGRGLAAAHAAGLVHRDVKPANVLVGDDGRVRVTDFGLARSPLGGLAPESHSVDDDDDELGESDGEITTAGTVLGTPKYMAPEQHGGGHVDARTDQYAFCVSLYEALVGQLPFPGDDMHEIAARKRAGSPSWPRSLPAWLGRVVLRGLATEPEERHHSMDALLAALTDDPTRKRRRRQIAGVAVLAIGSVFGVRQWNAAQDEARCESESRAIDDTWNADARTRIAVAFAGLGTPLASATVDRMTPWIDDYADRWRTTALASCRAIAVDGTRTAELGERASDCLAEKHAALAALIDTLAHAEPTLVPVATMAAASLPPLAECADEDALRRRPRAIDAQLRDQVAAQRSEHVAIRAMLAAGAWQAGLERAETALSTARALEWEPLLAEAHNTIGMAQMRLGQFEAAERSFQDAFVLAGQIGHDDVAIDAAQRLTYVVGSRLARTDEGMIWGRIARMLLARTGQTEGLRAADVANDIGTVHATRAEWVDAMQEMTLAQSLFVRELPERHPMHARMVSNLAAIESALGFDEAALAHMREAGAALERALGPEHPDIASAYDNIASLLAVLHRDNESELRTAITLRERALGLDHPDLVRSLCELAITLAGHDQGEEAAQLLERADRISAAAHPDDHPERARVLAARGRVHVIAGRHDEARVVLQRAHAIYVAAYGSDHPSTRDTKSGLDEIESVSSGGSISAAR